jgi:hypothetical protein
MADCVYLDKNSRFHALSLLCQTARCRRQQSHRNAALPPKRAKGRGKGEQEKDDSLVRRRAYPYIGMNWYVETRPNDRKTV